MDATYYSTLGLVFSGINIDALWPGYTLQCLTSAPTRLLVLHHTTMSLIEKAKEIVGLGDHDAAPSASECSPRPPKAYSETNSSPSQPRHANKCPTRSSQWPTETAAQASSYPSTAADLKNTTYPGSARYETPQPSNGT